MTRFRALTLAALVATTSVAAAPAVAAKKSAARLVSYPSCQAFLDETRSRVTPLVGAYGVSGYPGIGALARGRAVDGGPIALPSVAAPAAGEAADPVAGVDFSGTNVQEEGVGEPDVAVSDGRYIYSVTDETVRVIAPGNGSPTLVASISFEGITNSRLLISGRRLLVISDTYRQWSENGPIEDIPVNSGGPVSRAFYSTPETVVNLVDISAPTAPKVVETLSLEGSFVAARSVDAVVRLVTSSRPDVLPLQYPVDPTPPATQAAIVANRGVVTTAPLATWVPTMTLQKAGAEVGAPRRAVRCREIRRAKTFAGLGMLTVQTIDPAKGLTPVDSDAVMTDAETVYGSTTSLYVAGTRWFSPEILGGTAPAPEGITTQIHRFDITGRASTQYRASGTVPGYMLSQWSMSEKDDVLRVASTEQPPWNAGQENQSQSVVTTLKPNGATLERIGSVSGLGAGEQIYAVRFIGDLGYVVTFRRTDPLYVIDLSNPAQPAVRGQLKIPGYSAYLHPVGEDLLLGIGQDADDTGRVKGTQASLFDVSNPAFPTRISAVSLGGRWSEVESDHKAFLYWAPSRLAVVPVAGENGSYSYSSRGIGMKIGRASGLATTSPIEHPSTGAQPAQIRRFIVIGASLYSVSDAGVAADRLGDFTRTGWVAFPKPQPTPVPGPVPLPVQ
jgi:hypothetical protein